jgi:hypothetical protein
MVSSSSQSPQSITARLKKISRLRDECRTNRTPVDMSSAAVTRRIRLALELGKLCTRLGALRVAGNK